MEIKKLDDTSLKAFMSNVKTELAKKVDTEEGKGLSEANYTSEEKTKLEGISEGAEANVKPDWNSDESSDSGILNRTHYSTDLTIVADDIDTVNNECYFNFENGVELVVGKTYHVVWGDETEEDIVAESYASGRGVVLNSGIKESVCALYSSEGLTSRTGETFTGKFTSNPNTIKIIDVVPATFKDLSVKKLDNKYLDLADWVFSETAPIPSKEDLGLGNVDNTSDEDKPISTATQEALDNITELIPEAATSENKLIDKAAVEDMFNQNIADYISPNDSETSTPFQYTTYVARMEDATLPVLELGPWYKNGEYAGRIVDNNARSGSYEEGDVSIVKGDWAIVQYDESVCYCFIHGYKYQRKKDGGATANGTVIIPGVNKLYEAQHSTDPDYEPRKYDEISTYTIAGKNALGFGDWSAETFAKLGYYPVFIITSVTKPTGAIYEFAADATFTPDLTTVKGQYDLSLPTTRYVCTGTYSTGAPKFSFQYTLSDSAFTTPQLESINSTATIEKINQIAINTTAIEGKQDALDFDATYLSGYSLLYGTNSVRCLLQDATAPNNTISITKIDQGNGGLQIGVNTSMIATKASLDAEIQRATGAEGGLNSAISALGSALNALGNAKQDTLTTDQLAAVDSGITAEKITELEGKQDAFQNVVEENGSLKVSENLKVLNGDTEYTSIGPYGVDIKTAIYRGNSSITIDCGGINGSTTSGVATTTIQAISSGTSNVNIYSGEQNSTQIANINIFTQTSNESYFTIQSGDSNTKKASLQIASSSETSSEISITTKIGDGYEGNIIINSDNIKIIGKLKGGFRRLHNSTDGYTCNPDMFWYPPAQVDISRLTFNDNDYYNLDVSYTFQGSFIASGAYNPTNTTSNGCTISWYGDTTTESTKWYEFSVRRVSTDSCIGIITKLSD